MASEERNTAQQLPSQSRGTQNTPRHQNLESALTTFNHASASPKDEEKARIALDYLYRQSEAWARQYLARRYAIRDDQQIADLTQIVFARIWERRTEYQFASTAAWFAFLRTALQNTFIDKVVRSPRSSETTGEMAEQAAEQVSTTRRFVETLLDAAEAGVLQTLADRLFLEIDNTIPDEELDRRLLAAQMFYLDRLPWQTIQRRLGPIQRTLAQAGNGEAFLSRDALDMWIADPGTLRRLAFHALYYENDRLALFVLNAPEDSASSALDDLTRTAGDICNNGAANTLATWGRWTWGEALVLLWRCRNALLREQILARSDCPLEPEAVDALVTRMQEAFPFRREMESLVLRLGPDRSRQACKHTGFWQRLALQYRFYDDLPHRDILDRTNPAAEIVDYQLTSNQLNVWLSNGRLQARLAARYAKTDSGAAAAAEGTVMRG